MRMFVNTIIMEKKKLIKEEDEEGSIQKNEHFWMSYLSIS